MHDRFHPLPGRVPVEGETRIFTGDGSSQLFVPGLKQLIGIQVGTVHLALDTDVDARLDALPCGTPTLIRDETSNHGVWQRGVSVYVTGHWEATAA